MDWAGLAVFVTALGTLVTAIAGAILTLRVRNEVRTGNARTIGQLAEAVETRRIEVIPFEKRTIREQTHIDEAPEEDEAQGPAR